MKKLIVLAICFMFVGGLNCSAELLGDHEWEEKHTWEAATEIYYYTYEEPDLMENKGFMYGIDLSCTYRDNNLMLRGEGRFSYGQVDYDGALMGGTPYTIDNISDFNLEYRGLGGYDVSVLTATTLTPYIGIGYRYLNDDPSFDPAGYERESNYFYSPIGIETITELEDGWSVGITLEYEYFWKGIQKTHMSDVSPAYNDLENDQNEGYGCRGSIKIQRKSEKMDLIIEPFIRYWDIEESELALLTLYGVPYMYMVEPENNTTEYGIRLAVRY